MYAGPSLPPAWRASTSATLRLVTSGAAAPAAWARPGRGTQLREAPGARDIAEGEARAHGRGQRRREDLARRAGHDAAERLAWQAHAAELLLARAAIASSEASKSTPSKTLWSRLPACAPRGKSWSRTGASAAGVAAATAGGGPASSASRSRPSISAGETALAEATSAEKLLVRNEYPSAGERAATERLRGGRAAAHGAPRER